MPSFSHQYFQHLHPHNTPISNITTTTTTTDTNPSASADANTSLPPASILTSGIPPTHPSPHKHLHEVSTSSAVYADPDVTLLSRHYPHAPVKEPFTPDTRASHDIDNPAVKVDSRSRTAVASVTAAAASSTSSVKSRAHSRLASLSLIRAKGSAPQQSTPVGVPAAPKTHQATSLPTQELSVSPSWDSSSHKPSDFSTVSNTSSETNLSEDSTSDKTSLLRRPSKSSFWAKKRPSLESVNDHDTADDRASHSNTAIHQTPRMMHQTSSRLLRMTEDNRPFTRDFKDLFSTLMVSLPLDSHRVRFSRIEHTFTTSEAITNLGSLKFSQSNRMPDPKDLTRIVTTTTTTTFSMAQEMARNICLGILEARLIESVEGKTDFSSKNAVWQLTPKGMRILSRFCQRNGIHQRHVNEVLDSPRNIMQLVIVERDPATDKLDSDPATIHVIFRRFVGDAGPNLRSNSSSGSSDTDSLNDYATGLVGVKMTRVRRPGLESPYAFTGKAAFDWIMDCCMVVDKREVHEIMETFLQSGLVNPVGDGPAGAIAKFVPTKQALYTVTQKGMRVAGWITSPNGSVNSEATVSRALPNGVTRDSNTNRMTVIIRDPALRLLFREYLIETHCEENLSFYTEVTTFLKDYERAKRGHQPRVDVIRETLASAYNLYNAFLAPGSPCELNIDHNLRNALAARMTRAAGEDEAMVRSLDEVSQLFDQAQSSVFKLMASDSVPKFSREPKYASVLRERNLENMITNFASASIS